MANWLHRTTKEYMGSNDPPLDHQSAWIKNPDLSAVAGETVDAWIVDGDTVRLPTEQEWVPIRAARLLAAQQAKLAAIDAKSAAIVTRGVEVSPGVSISTSLAASQNLQDIWIGHQSGMDVFPLKLSTLDGGTFNVATASAFTQVMLAFAQHKRPAYESGQVLRAQVLAATTVAEVDAVQDNRT